MATVSVLVFVALWNPEPIASALRSTVHTVLWPVEKLFSGTASWIRDAGDLLLSIGELNRENEALVEENIRLQAKNAELRFLEDENEALRRAAGFDVRKSFDVIAAEVIALGGEGERGFVIIDRGIAQGIKPGMPIIVGDGILIGVVDESYPTSARVMLITNSSSSFGGVTVDGQTQGIVRGQRGLGVSFATVLKNDPVHVGDRVVTSGIGSTLPSGLFVGTVERSEESADRLSRVAAVVSPVDFSKLRFLFCIRNIEAI